MKRWNGWGEETITSPLSESAITFLHKTVGIGTPPSDIALADMIQQVPPSRLPSHPLVSDDPIERVRHARGQSLPDWVALRSGHVACFPDGVACPEHAGEVRELLAYAERVGAVLIPYGGGTSVVGHINPLAGDRPILTVDLGRMSRLQFLDETNQLATFAAGISGQDLEAQLRAHGYTLGHYPQSFEYSTLGGWIATRSSGQQSLGYGRIEQLFAGGHIETPLGTLDIAPLPASATGLDLREIVLGSEGRLGIITEAMVRIRKIPEYERFPVVFFAEWEQALAAVRHMVQARLKLTMLRLSTPIETRTNLLLAGHERTIKTLEQLLVLRGVSGGKCMLMVGIAGRKQEAQLARKEALRIASSFKGISVGSFIGRQWQKNRFKTPYARNTLWKQGYAVDTLETATTWDRVQSTLDAIEMALRQGLHEEGERVHTFSHLSHLYPHGSAMYTTYIYRLAADPQQTLQRWQKLKHTASNALVEQHATMSHQHGVGTDHLPYLIAEKGELGLMAMRQLYHQFDPHTILNPGKLVV